MAFEHEDAAVTIEPDTARRLLARATPRGRRLLELFARRQLLAFDDLRREFGVSQNGLNALLGHLTREFQELQSAPGFYIYLSRLNSWAIGHASGVNLRRALRAEQRSRQRRIAFAEERARRQAAPR